VKGNAHRNANENPRSRHFEAKLVSRTEPGDGNRFLDTVWPNAKVCLQYHYHGAVSESTEYQSASAWHNLA
jgi:hypothetical protein